MKIFIIDDDHLSIFLTRNMLDLEGTTHTIQTFLSASAALGVLHACTDDTIPDLIFLDLNMPLMDGWDFLEALAPLHEKLDQKCSLYILTSSLDISETNRMQDYPVVTGLLHKPITSEDIQLVFNQFRGNPPMPWHIKPITQEHTL
ncbi:response regulator [Pontibacter brevis]